MIELIVHWEDGFGKYNWILWKNILITICGIACLFFAPRQPSRTSSRRIEMWHPNKRSIEMLAGRRIISLHAMKHRNL